MIFSVKQIQEKGLEQNKDLYMVFVHPMKEFDIVNRDGLWITLHTLGLVDLRN